MNNEDMAGRIMAHAFHDELEKVALRKVLKQRMRHLTDGYRFPSENYSRLTYLGVKSNEELHRAQSHELGRRAARLFRQGREQEAQEILEQGRFHKEVAKIYRKSERG